MRVLGFRKGYLAIFFSFLLSLTVHFLIISYPFYFAALNHQPDLPLNIVIHYRGPNNLHVATPKPMPHKNSLISNNIGINVNDGTFGSLVSHGLQTDNESVPKNSIVNFDVLDAKYGAILATATLEFSLDDSSYSIISVIKYKHDSFRSNINRVILISRGSVDGNGLRPMNYEQQVWDDDDNMVSNHIIFDWSNSVLLSPDGRAVHLPENTQDPLSFYYQLFRVHLNSEFFSFPIAYIFGVESVKVEVGSGDLIKTPSGDIFALHLHNVSSKILNLFEVWISFDKNKFPVKFLKYDPFVELDVIYVMSGIN
jgi:Protein of unknown function (DUF3108)